MDSLKSIRVLRNTNNKEDFEEGNIVKITTYGSYETTGKITWIDTQYIEVDYSEKYQSKQRKFEFKDILKIEKVTE